MEEKNIGIEQRLNTIKSKLDLILKNRKLSFVSLDSEVDEIFSISIENLSKMPPQKLAEYAFVISRYSVFLQKELNKQKAIISWIKRQLDYIVLNEMSEYRSGFMTGEEVKMKATRGNDVAKELYMALTEAEQETIIISDLSIDIRKMGESLTDISKAKRYNNG